MELSLFIFFSCVYKLTDLSKWKLFQNKIYLFKSLKAKIQGDFVLDFLPQFNFSLVSEDMFKKTYIYKPHNKTNYPLMSLNWLKWSLSSD